MIDNQRRMSNIRFLCVLRAISLNWRSSYDGVYKKNEGVASVEKTCSRGTFVRATIILAVVGLHSIAVTGTVS